MEFFKNYDQLTAAGKIQARKDALAIAEAGIRASIPYNTTKELVSLCPEGVAVGKDVFSLPPGGKIYLIGAGKGSLPIAEALTEILGGRIAEGFVAVKEGQGKSLPGITVFESSHPVPDARSLHAGQEILRIVQKAGEKDIIFAAITGGSSALVNLPLGDITERELQTLNLQLLNCGGTIGEINTVRKHIDGLKGGRLVRHAQPAQVITLTLDTASPGMPWPDLSLPDYTTFEQAINILKLYDLYDEVPHSVRAYLEKGLTDPTLESVKDFTGMKSRVYSVADPRSCCLAACRQAEKLGYHGYILGSALEGEAREMGVFFAGIAKEIQEHARPFQRPCAIISGGETTVTIHGEAGNGGPNQETALGFAARLNTQGEIACVSIDTDGTDGPGQIAGGIADTETKRRASALGIRLEDVLKRHDSAAALQALGDAIVTGHTGTNVMNLRILIVQ